MIYLYENNRFTPKTYEELLFTKWNDGEDQSEFLKRAEFGSYSYKFGEDLIAIWTKENGEGHYMTVDMGSSIHEFYVPHFIELVNLLKFFGLNFYEEMAKKCCFKRILPLEQISHTFPEFQSITPLYEDKMLITSEKPIQSISELHEERILIRAEKKKKEEANKAGEKQDKLA